VPQPAEAWQAAQNSQGSEKGSGLALSAKPIQVADGLAGNRIGARFRREFGLGFFDPDFRQLTRVEPVTIAVRALVDFDFAAGAEEMALQFHVLASRTGPFPGDIDDERGVAMDIEQKFTRALFLFVHLLEFECVEPNAAAAAMAGIDGESSHAHLSEFIEASRAFHR